MDAEDVEPAGEELAEPQGPVMRIMSTLADLDPSALVVGFITIMESIEEDGTESVCLIHSKMPPWHLEGLLGYVRNWDPGTEAVAMFEDDDGYEDC